MEFPIDNWRSFAFTPAQVRVRLRPESPVFVSRPPSLRVQNADFDHDIFSEITPEVDTLVWTVLTKQAIVFSPYWRVERCASPSK